MKTILTLVVVLVGFVGNAQDKGKVYRLTYEQVNELKKMYDSIYDYERIENEFLTIINHYRQENNLTVLTRDSTLDDFVSKQNTYNRDNHLNGHNSQITWEERCKSFKPYKIHGENALRTCFTFCFDENKRYSIGENIFNGWKQSIGHNKIMLSKGNYKIGISILENTSREIFAVMVLAY